MELSPNEQLFVGTLANAYRYSGQTDQATPLYDRAIALCFKAFQVNPEVFLEHFCVGDLLGFHVVYRVGNRFAGVGTEAPTRRNF